MYQTRHEMIQKLLTNSSSSADSTSTSTSNSSNPERNSLLRQRQWTDIEQLIEVILYLNLCVLILCCEATYCIFLET